MKAKACIAALVGALAAAPPAPDAVPRDLHAGVRVRLQATMTRPRTVVAEGVEIVAGAEGEDGLKAVIETVDPKAKTLTALGIKVVASDATVLHGESHEQVSFSAIRPGRRVSAKGTFRGDATLVASKLTIRPEKPEKARDVTLEGPVQQVDSGSMSFTVLGVTVILTPQTKIERGGRGGEGLAGRVVTGAAQGEAPPSIPSYGVIWEERFTRSGAPRDEAGWTWLRTHGVRSVVNFRFLPEDAEASERARFERYLSLPFKGKEPPTEAGGEVPRLRPRPAALARPHPLQGREIPHGAHGCPRAIRHRWLVDRRGAGGGEALHQGQGPVRAGRQLAPPLGCQSRARQLRPL